MLRQHWERIHQYLGDWHAVLGSDLQVGGVDNPIHRLNKIPPKLPPFCRPPKKRGGLMARKNGEQSQGYASFVEILNR